MTTALRIPVLSLSLRAGIGLVLTAVWICWALPGRAADRLVAPDGSGPYATIQDAVEAVGVGDNVVLMAGTYTGPGNRNIYSDGSLTIRRQNPGDEVIIDLQGSAASPAYGFLIADGTMTLEGLTIRGGYHPNGGAVNLQAGAFLANHCRFLDNTATRGGAIRCAGGDRVVLSECILAWNTGSVEGGAVYATSFADVELSSCTLFMNASSAGTAVFQVMDATLAMDRCIVAYGKGIGYPFEEYYGGPVTASNSDIWGNHGGDWVGAMAAMLGVDGNISVEPRMCDPMEENFAVTAGSPCYVPPMVLMGGGNMDLTWWVPVYGLRADGTGMFATVQDAADAVPHYAAIALETGGYTGPGNTDIGFRGKHIELYSREYMGAVFSVSYGGGPQSRAFRLHEREPAGTTIRNVYITGARVDTAPLNPGIGAGILVTGDASVTLQDIYFTNNFARGGGEAVGVVAPAGDVVIERCSFVSHDYASVVYADGGTLRLDDVLFPSNNAGSLSLESGLVAATLRNVRVSGTEGVTATNLGAAPVLFEDCDLQLADGFAPTGIVGCDNVAFLNCTLRDGGAVAGEIVLADASTLAFTGCGFTGTGAAGVNVAAVTAHASTLDFQQCTFTDLRPDAARGAVVLSGASIVNLDGCTFLRTTTGIAASDLFLLVLTLDGCRFEAADTAIRIVGTSASHRIELTGTEFVGCGRGLDLTDCYEVTVADCGFRGTGPGMPIRAIDSFVDVSGSEFHDAVVADAPGHDAGGILSQGGYLAVTTSEFLRNTCAGGPGGINATGGGLSVSDCVLADNINQSYDMGGAIYCWTTNPASIRGTRLERNTAYDGGGLHVIGVDVAITDCEFLANTAAHDGGGLLLNLGLLHSAEVTGCLVAGNTAPYGGGIYIQEAVEVRLTGCTLVGNGGPGGAEQIGINASAALDISYSIIAHGTDGPALAAGYPPDVTLGIACTDIFGNTGGDWTGMAAPFAVVSGNLAANPGFCDPDAGDFQLAADSPCLATGNTCGVTMGALGAGCSGVSATPDAPTIRLVALQQNRPNPFNPATRIVFELPDPADVTLRVYDVGGRLVRTILTAEPLPGGVHDAVWNGRDDGGLEQAAGMYFYRLDAGQVRLVRKMSLVK